MTTCATQGPLRFFLWTVVRDRRSLSGRLHAPPRESSLAPASLSKSDVGDRPVTASPEKAKVLQDLEAAVGDATVLVSPDGEQHVLAPSMLGLLKRVAQRRSRALLCCGLSCHCLLRRRLLRRRLLRRRLLRRRLSCRRLLRRRLLRCRLLPYRRDTMGRGRAGSRSSRRRRASLPEDDPAAKKCNGHDAEKRDRTGHHAHSPRRPSVDQVTPRLDPTLRRAGTHEIKSIPNWELALFGHDVGDQVVHLGPVPVAPRSWKHS